MIGPKRTKYWSTQNMKCECQSAYLRCSHKHHAITLSLGYSLLTWKSLGFQTVHLAQQKNGIQGQLSHDKLRCCNFVCKCSRRHERSASVLRTASVAIALRPYTSASHSRSLQPNQSKSTESIVRVFVTFATCMPVQHIAKVGLELWIDCHF